MSDSRVYKTSTLLEILSESKVEIPIIQRDYAQGRKDQEEIRANFLQTLYEAFQGKPIQLDFIYGSLDHGVIQPLDGQQRLTTLFLLTWYLGQKEDRLTPELRVILSRFTYETRVSSREFCRDLVSHVVDIRPDEEGLKNKIVDRNWFIPSWSLDPTIQAMLLMIDSIHEKFRRAPDWFEVLTKVETCPVTFLYLPLEKIGLTDELYIKMNARGRPLSNFENLKARLEKHIGQQPYAQEMFVSPDAKPIRLELKHYFAFSIDTRWADMVWSLTQKGAPTEKRTDRFDRYFENFFNTVMVNTHATVRADDTLKSLLEVRPKKIPFRKLQEEDFFSERFVKDIIGLLDLMTGARDDHGQVSRRSFLSDQRWFDEPAVFEQFLTGTQKDAAYKDRILFHAYCQYILRWRSTTGFTDQVGLQAWMRVVHNLVAATSPFNNEREFSGAIRAIERLVEHGQTILETLPTLNAIDGLDKWQFEEEKRKALLIQKGEGWARLVESAELHKYFDGQIGFLLRFAGMWDVLTTGDSSSWSAEVDLEFSQRFMSYWKKCQRIFDDNGLVLDREYIVQRSLLVFGDYRLPESRNFSFVCRNLDRDISWRRFLKGQGQLEKLELLRQVLDLTDEEAPFDTLRSFLTQAPQLPDWRRYFIELPQLFDYMSPSKQSVREQYPQGFAILKGERMSGEHVELVTYSIWLRENLSQVKLPYWGNPVYNSSNSDDAEQAPRIVCGHDSKGTPNLRLEVLSAMELGKIELRITEFDQGTQEKILSPLLEELRFTRSLGCWVKTINSAAFVPVVSDIGSKLEMALPATISKASK